MCRRGGRGCISGPLATAFIVVCDAIVLLSAGVSSVSCVRGTAIVNVVCWGDLLLL